MVPIAYHNQFIKEFGKKCTILFLYCSAIMVVHNSPLLLMEMFKSYDSLQLAFLCVRSGLHAMPNCQQLFYVNLTMTKPSRQFYVRCYHF